MLENYSEKQSARRKLKKRLNELVRQEQNGWRLEPPDDGVAEGRCDSPVQHSMIERKGQVKKVGRLQVPGRVVDGSFDNFSDAQNGGLRVVDHRSRDQSAITADGSNGESTAFEIFQSTSAGFCICRKPIQLAGDVR